MSKGHIQPGNILPYANSGQTAIASGSVVVFPAMIGIALAVIPTGETGELGIGEAWQLPKEASLAVDQGVHVYWNIADGEVTTAVNDGAEPPVAHIPCGRSFAPAADSDTTIQVRLNS